MIKKTVLFDATILLLLFFILIPAVSTAQNLLANPESIVYDENNKRYLVSNTGPNNGNIVEIDSVGNQRFFTTDLDISAGLHIVDNTLFVACIASGLKGYNLTTGEKTMDLNIPGMQLLNDVTSDTSGYLYITDSEARKIFRVRLSDQSYSTFVSLSYIYPNGIIFDKKENRLLVCYGENNSPIQAIDINSRSVETIIHTGLSFLDGIAEDDQGHYYFSSNGTHAVYRYDREFANPPEKVSSGHITPADIFYNKKTHILAVPNLRSDYVDFNYVPSIYINLVIHADSICGHAPMQINFRDTSFAYPEIDSWAWDFDNDGIIDSNEESASWTYTEPGNYSVRLVASNDTIDQEKVFENFIHIFDGKSALLFNGDNSLVTCPASPTLNLTESVTIEGWINPNGWGALPGMGFGRIVDKSKIALFLNGEGGSLNQHSLSVWLVTDGASPGFVSSPENSIVLNEWQHVAINYDGSSSEIKIFINGIEQTLSYTGGQPSGNISDNINFDFRIGSASNGMTFNGIIDEIRVWDVVRRSDQIHSKMDNYLYGDEAGLVGYWQMDEGNGAILADKTTNENNCSANNAEWIQGFDLGNATFVIQKNDMRENTISDFSLKQNYPNPFNPETNIEFSLNKNSDIQLIIYDIKGRLVKTLINENREKGVHKIKWDGTDHAGEKAPSGLYLYTITGKGFDESNKMIMLK